MSKYIVALDQGTTSSRAILFDKQGRIVSSAQTETRQLYPQPGWVEQDPMEIWASQLAVLTEARAMGNVNAADIAAMGITNQRETTIVWDKNTGEPAYNAIVWQCRRTAEICKRLTAEGWAEPIRQKTGLVIDAYFSATKLHWLLENVPGLRARAERGDLLFGTVDSWLVWRLTKGRHHVTDYSNASRTMLFNIHDLAWDEDILAALNIPAAMLPEVRPSSHVYGSVDPEFMGCDIPIAGIAGDQQAALFGQCCHQPGMVKNTYGTGCFILMNTGAQAVVSSCGLITTIAWGVEGKVEYALEGSVFSAGAAVQWLRDGLGILPSAPLSEDYAMKAEDTGGVYMVPAFVGLGAPYWNQHARGALLGITRGSTKEHIVRATLESIAYQSYDVMKAMEGDAGMSIRALRVDGGAAANNFLMQFQADILDAKVLRPVVIESTALGACYLAGLAVGYYRDKEEITQNAAIDRVFTPNMAAERRGALVSGWRKAVARSLDWAE